MSILQQKNFDEYRTRNRPVQPRGRWGPLLFWLLPLRPVRLFSQRPQGRQAHVAESGRLRSSGAACAKKGASGRMQRPAELVPIRYGPLMRREGSVKAP